MTPDVLPDYIHEFFRDFLAARENNNLGPGRTDEAAWQDFVIGYSSGDDDLYEFWKRHIGPFHWSPAEAFAAGMTAEARERGVAALAPTFYPDNDASPSNGAGSRGAADGAVAASSPHASELTVISWALSHTDATKADNRREKAFPSERWARARVYGQSRNRALHRALLTVLVAQGYSAVAPALLLDYSEEESDNHGQSSTWSERHVAHTSGLGTFGLCGGLITELGQAVRFGSVVVHALIPATTRPYSGSFDYCLYFNGVDCTECIDRCPVDSSGDSADRKLSCAEHLKGATAEFVESEFGFKGYGCGLCQTGVPCESGIPRTIEGVTTL